MTQIERKKEWHIGHIQNPKLSYTSTNEFQRKCERVHEEQVGKSMEKRIQREKKKKR